MKQLWQGRTALFLLFICIAVSLPAQYRSPNNGVSGGYVGSDAWFQDMMKYTRNGDSARAAQQAAIEHALRAGTHSQVGIRVTFPEANLNPKSVPMLRIFNQRGEQAGWAPYSFQVTNSYAVYHAILPKGGIYTLEYMSYLGFRDDFGRFEVPANAGRTFFVNVVYRKNSAAQPGQQSQKQNRGVVPPTGNPWPQPTAGPGAVVPPIDKSWHPPTVDRSFSPPHVDQPFQSAPVSPQGKTDISVNPAFTTLQHSRFTISYPSNWNVFGDLQSQVLIVPEGGISGQALISGVLIDTLPRKNPAAAFSQADYLAACDQLVPEREIGGNSTYPGGVAVTASDRHGYMGREYPMTSAIEETLWIIVLPQGQNLMLAVEFMGPSEPGKSNASFEDLQPIYKAMLSSLKLR